jgi:hypothetical protein
MPDAMPSAAMEATAGSGVGAPSPNADSSVFGGERAGSLPPAFVGVFHLVEPNPVDTYNLRIHERGAFKWDVSGCDFFGGDHGRVESTGDRLTFLPEPGRTSFDWVLADVVVSEPAERVEVELLAPGTLIVRGSSAEQKWMSGAFCPYCGGPLGPTRPPSACLPPQRLDL